MPVYTYAGDLQGGVGTAAIVVASGLVRLGDSNLFTAAEAALAQADGINLIAGPAISPASQLLAPSVAAGIAGNPNGVYRYCVTFVTAVGETTAGPEFGPVTLTSVQGNVTAIPLGSASSGVTARKLYRTAAGGASGTEKLVTTINDNTTTTFTDNVADGTLGAVLPTLDTSYNVLSLQGFPWARYPSYVTTAQQEI